MEILDKAGLTYFWSKIKAKLNGKIDNNAALLTTNPFRVLSGYSGEGQSVYISKIDNALYCADKRYNVSAVVDGAPVSSSNLAFLFNGDYENKVVVAEGKTAVITFDFSNLSGAKFPNYPYGYIYVSFYHIGMPDTITGRVYNNYSSQGVGWKDITFTRVFGSVYRARQSYYGLQTLEITITGKTNGNYKTEIAQIEMHLDRPNPSRNPFLSKYNAEELYYNLTAPSFTGRLIGNADSASAVNGHTVNADVPANAEFTDTTYSTMTQAQATAGTDTTGRLITAKVLKDTIDAKLPTAEDLTITPITPSGVSSISYIRAARYGKVIHVQGLLKLGSNSLSSSVTIATGLPVPPYNVIAVGVGEPSTQTSFKRNLDVRVDTSGNLNVRYGAGSASYVFNFSYIEA